MEPTMKEPVCSYKTYEEAQAAVVALADKGFPVQCLSIVAEDLQFVEDITGRRGYGDAVGQSLLSGALVSASIGFFFGLFSLIDPSGVSACPRVVPPCLRRVDRCCHWTGYTLGLAGPT